MKYFNLKKFRKCLSFIREAAVDSIECDTITTPVLDSDNEKLLRFNCKALEAIDTLGNVNYDDYSDAPLLKDYVADLVHLLTPPKEISAHIYRDIVNAETGEVYFSGEINILSNNFISDDLIYDSADGKTIYFKEMKE